MSQGSQPSHFGSHLVAISFRAPSVPEEPVDQLLMRANQSVPRRVVKSWLPDTLSLSRARSLSLSLSLSRSLSRSLSLSRRAGDNDGPVPHARCLGSSARIQVHTSGYG